MPTIKEYRTFQVDPEMSLPVNGKILRQNNLVNMYIKSRRNLDCKVIEERLRRRGENLRNVQKRADTRWQAKNQYTSVGIARGSFLQSGCRLDNADKKKTNYRDETLTSRFARRAETRLSSVIDERNCQQFVDIDFIQNLIPCEKIFVARIYYSRQLRRTVLLRDLRKIRQTNYKECETFSKIT